MSRKLQSVVYIILLSMNLLLSQEICCTISSQDSAQMHELNFNFTYPLLKKAYSKSRAVVVCPYGIYRVFQIAYLGSQGSTRVSFQKFFSYPESNEKCVALFSSMNRYFANSLYDTDACFVDASLTLQHSFKEQVNKDLGADIMSVQFQDSEQALQTINTWVEKSTQGSFHQFLKSQDISPFTRLVLVDILHYRGLWSNPFAKRDTYEAVFTKADEEQITVPMMHLIDSMPALECDTFYGVALDMHNSNEQGAQVQGIILLPKDTISIDALVQGLDQNMIDSTIKSMKDTLVSLHVPRSRITTTLDLKDVLISLGFCTPFQKEADFSGIAINADLYIQKALQKITVDFYEEGLEATSASSIVMNMKCIHQQSSPMEVRCNRPYIFLLIDTQIKLPIFIAVMNDIDANMQGIEINRGNQK